MKISGTTGEQLEISILRRSNPKSLDYWDANWLECEIKIIVSNFNSIYGTNLRVEELQKFYADLIKLQKGIENEALFITIEEGLYLECKIKRNGILEITGKATNEVGNNLSFSVQTDFTSLDTFINEMKAALEIYPLKGKVSENVTPSTVFLNTI